MSVFKRPPVAVGDTVSFYRWKNSEAKAMVVTKVEPKTLTGIVFAPSGAGFTNIDCVFHVDDPELDERPQMQESMWDHNDQRKMVNKIWDHLGLGEVKTLESLEMKKETRMDAVQAGEERELDHVRRMIHMGCLDKGRICKETGVHHKRVEKEINAFLADKRARDNS